MGVPVGLLGEGERGRASEGEKEREGGIGKGGGGVESVERRRKVCWGVGREIQGGGRGGNWN